MKFERIVLILSILNIVLLYMLLTATQWPVTGDGLFSGAVRLLRTQQYISFAERYLEFIAIYISYFFVLLISYWHFIKKSFSASKKKTKIIMFFVFLLPLYLFFLLPFSFGIRWEFQIWTYALLGFPTHDLWVLNDYSPIMQLLNWTLLFIGLTFPESLVTVILLSKIRHGKL